jgi:hypothetical protein
MATPLHKSDYKKLPREDEVMDALRPFAIPPGDYLVPCAATHKDAGTPEFQEKWKKGPVAMATFFENGPVSMAKPLSLWFLYCLVVGVIAAYVTSRAVGAGAPFRAVFRFAGVTTFVSYSLALWQNTIWFKRSWVTTLKANLDGLLFSLVTAGIFGWLWPR